MNTKPESQQDIPAEPRKRGPKPSGTPRSEVFKRSSKNYRESQLKAGKVEIKAFVEPSTRTALETIKTQLGLEAKASLGAVLDALMQQKSK